MKQCYNNFLKKTSERSLFIFFRKIMLFANYTIFVVMDKDYIKLIFGLKLKQIRTERELSLYGLSKLSGLSKSYLNEIEKGKKYPKPDKIASLSKHLDIPYDDLVSLKLDKNLAPIGEILQSKVLQEIPLELFGIQENTMIDIISNAPQKVTAFISTIIEIAKNYSFTKESFYLASVRSFQEAHLNYFEHLEAAVLKFAKTYQINLNQPISSSELEDILTEEFKYTIDENELENHSNLEHLRSLYVPKTKTLLINKQIDDAQKTFIFAKELAYNYLAITERPHTFTWITFDTFDEVLNNFYASYFAGALVIPKASIVNDVKHLFSSSTFNTEAFTAMLSHYNASPESIFQRLTNILPKAFGLKDLFFLRFSHKSHSSVYELNKELHLTKEQPPRAKETNEHYCRRWVSLRVLDSIARSKNTHEFDMQISNYPEDNKQYLVIASATKDPFKTDQYRSISIGVEINNQLKKKVEFLNDPSITTLDVGVTCQRCNIKDCEVRQAEPKIYYKHLKDEKTVATVKAITKKYS